MYGHGLVYLILRCTIWSHEVEAISISDMAPVVPDYEQKILATNTLCNVGYILMA
jgi:hypothetical protein